LRGPAKHLSKGVAIYGAGDAIANLVNFLLLPVYVKFRILTPADYGALGLILSAEAFSKIAFRWGLDGAFMRFYYERDEGLPRQRMASTIVWFMAAANVLLVTAALVAAPWIAALMRLDGAYLTPLRLMFVNMALIGFTFIPMHAMRMRKEAATYSAFTFARAVGQIVLRIVLVIGLGFGVMGVYLTDVVLTLVLLGFMAKWFRALVIPAFSMDELRQSLRFALPRLPAGIASQALDSAPRLLLGQSFSQNQVGVYQNGSTLGTGVSFFRTAFETAWAPFYYETSKRPDARVIFGKMVTYGVAILALLVAGTAAVAREAVLLVLNGEYLAAIPVVPMIGVAMGLQGVYLLTSIGLNLTKRTEFYSVATITAALVEIGAGVWLIPRLGVVGAAGTVLLAYAVQALVAGSHAQRLYPIPYEIGRIARVVLAAAAAAAVALTLPTMPPLAGLLARGGTTVAVYLAALWVSGFFRPTERAFMREMIARVKPAGPAPIDVN
jgi:O-antigen/teichoic acid export membrane protein